MKNICMLMFFMLLMLTLSSVFASAAGVVISEILYDPIATESGGEFIELYNTGEVAVNISNWVIATGSSVKDAVIPLGIFIPANGYFLLTDSGWSDGKDDALWPESDYEEPITLGNSDSGVILYDSLGVKIDSVGWGEAPDGFFEAESISGVSPGNSLSRTLGGLDTNNNLFDFSESKPTPRNSEYNPYSSLEMDFEINIEDSLPLVSSVYVIDEDLVKEGVQIYPSPNLNRELEILVYARDETESVTGLFQDDEISFENKGEYFLGIIDLAYTLLPGIYDIKISAESSVSSDLEVNITEFEYMGLAAVELDASSFTFPSVVSKGVTVFSNSSSSLKNVGNVALDFEIHKTSIRSESDVISYFQMGYIFETLPMINGTISDSPEIVDVNLGVGKSVPLSFWLTVPTNISSGTYFGKTMLSVVESK